MHVPAGGKHADRSLWSKELRTQLLDELNARHNHEIVYFEPLLGPDTAVLAAGFPAVAVFVNDQVDADVIKQLAAGGTKLVTTRSTGYNQIDLAAAKKSGIKLRGLPITLPIRWQSIRWRSFSRSIAKFPGYNRTREGNFELDGSWVST